jgi:hypothetical protein
MRVGRARRGVQLMDRRKFLATGAALAPASMANSAQNGVALQVEGGRPSLDGREIHVDRPHRRTIAVMQDLQPDANPDHKSDAGGFPDQVQICRDILNELRVHHPDVNHLVVGGDIIDRGIPKAAEVAANKAPYYDFSDVFSDLAGSGVAYISPLSGNHDRDYRPLAERTLPQEGDPFYHFKRFFQKTFYYEIWGNFLFIYLGDMGEGTEGIITDFVFDWYTRVVETHAGFNKIVFSHQPVFGTGMATSSNRRSEQYIRLSERFTDHMKLHPISMWFSGHVMGRTATKVSQMHSVAQNGCTFVNAGVHISAHAEKTVTDLTYPLVHFTDGSNRVEITRWDHIAKDYVALGAITLTMPFPARLASLPSHTRHHVSALDPLEGTRTSFKSIELEADGSISTGPYWVTDRIVDDRYGANIPANLEVGHLLQIPGGKNADPENKTHNYGAGGALTVVKKADSGSNYTADIVGYASGRGKGTDSLVEAFRGHADGSLSTPNGLRTHYTSDWTQIYVDARFKFKHKLGTTDFEVVYIKLKTVADGRVFRVAAGVSPDGHGFTVEDSSKNVIEVACAPSGVFLRPETGAAPKSFDGLSAGAEIEMQICLRKIPTRSA